MNIHPTEKASRVEPKPTKYMRPQWLEILGRIPGDGLKGEGFPHNVLGMIMYNPATTGPFLEFWVTSKLNISLGVREQEIVILRMACLYRSDYVWKHHVPVGQEFGLSDVELSAICNRNYDEFLSERDKSLLCLTDELVEERTIRPQVWNIYKEYLKDQEILDLISLVSQYVFFALVNNSFQVQIEQPLKDVKGISLA